MNKKIINSIFLSFLIIVCLYGSVSAETLAPDRSAQVLDLLALECQKITDFSFMAQNGDLSQYENIKRHVLWKKFFKTFQKFFKIQKKNFIHI